jgi:hypothetical protein
MPKKKEPGIETVRTTTAHNIEGANAFGEVELHKSVDPHITISVGGLKETTPEKITMSVEAWVHVAHFILDIEQQLAEAEESDDES